MAATSKSAFAKAPKLSRNKKPEHLSLDDWQRELRRQYGASQKFQLHNLGGHAFYSDFEVTNPESKRTYRVAIRGREPGENYCSCPDFKTNTLGTCKHVEFTLAKLLDKRGAKQAFARKYQPSFSEVYLTYAGERTIRFRAGQDAPVELLRLASKFFDDEGQLEKDAYGRFDQFLSKASKLDCEIRVYEDALDFAAQVRDVARRTERVAKMFPRGVKSAALNKLLKVPLYPYQKEGALFAARAGRCLLADEMGLGKTIQAIAAAEIMARLYGVERVLVVCPTSLKHQWEREIERFTDRTVGVVYGLRKERQEHFQKPAFFKVINYEIVPKDLDLIQAWSPDLVILDEAQRIKNWATKIAAAVKRIRSTYAVVLTGTPLENRIEELISIVQFVDAHRLGPTYRLLHNHQIREGESSRVVGYQNLDRVSQTLAPILLRRRKSEVLQDLPGRIEKLLFVPMRPMQRKHHEENKETVARIVHKWRRFGFLTESDQLALRCALQMMRMSCDSTYLIDEKTDDGVKPDELMALLEDLFEEPRTKVVVFSTWLRMHELLADRLERRGLRYVLFHGGVPGPKRKELVERFRQDPDCRVFLSTDAGGVGLNLQHAHVVVNMDLPWNPAVLEQRIGRVHRIGQTQPVQVVNFVAQGTIEEGMLSVLGFKKSLFAGVLDGGEKEVMLGGGSLKQFMNVVDTVTSKMPAAPTETQEEETSGVQAAETTAEVDSEEPDAGERSHRPEPDPITELARTGISLLSRLIEAPKANGAGGGRSNGLSATVDESDGRTYLKIAVPEPEALRELAASFKAILDKFIR